MQLHHSLQSLGGSAPLAPPAVSLNGTEPEPLHNGTLLQDKNAGSPANSPNGSPLRDRKVTVSGADVV